MSGHLACLRDCGLVVGRLEGRQVFYSIAHPELMDLLGATGTETAAGQRKLHRDERLRWATENCD